jgi:hypothetical protein
MPPSSNSIRQLAAAAFAALAAAAMPEQAFAQLAGAAMPTNTLGGIVNAAGTDLAKSFLLFLVAAAYLTGFWLCFIGLWKLAANADKGFTHDGAWLDGIMRIAGGSLLIAMPDVLNCGLYTLYQDTMGYQGSISHAAGGGGSVTDCLTGAGSGSTQVMTCVAKNVATNLVPVFVEVAFIMFYIVGIGMVFHVIHGLAKSSAHGSRGAPEGWLPRLIIGVLICNVPHLMQSLEVTLGFGAGEILANGAQGLTGGMAQPPSLLAYSGAGTSIAALQQFSTLIGWVFVIMVMFGVLSVWRGLMHLKALSEGNRQSSMGNGITHIVAGVFLANAKASTCALMSTFVGNGLGWASAPDIRHRCRDPGKRQPRRRQNGEQRHHPDVAVPRSGADCPAACGAGGSG